MKCPHCQKEIADDAQSCPFCWKKITKDVKPNDDVTSIENEDNDKLNKLLGEKVLYKARTSGSWIVAIGFYLALFLLVMFVLTSIFGNTNTMENTEAEISVIAILLPLIFLGAFLIYGYREIRFLSHNTYYLATPTRLLFRTKLLFEGEHVKEMLYWKDVTGMVCIDYKKIVVSLSDSKKLTLRNIGWQQYEHLYYIWQSILGNHNSYDANAIACIFQSSMKEINEQYKKIELMTTKEKILTWIAIIFIPLGIPATCYIYYKWNKINPQKATQLNKHSWAAFFVALIIRGGIYFANSFGEGEPDSNVSVEESIELRDRNNKSEDDAWKLSEAIEQYRRSAEQGDAKAQFYLGLIYSSGEGVEKDMDKAMEWWYKAAEQGDDEAQFHLGVCYYDGDGVPKDMAKAVEWLQKAAEQGNDDAQYCLGDCYENGDGVPKDMKKAFEWWYKAAEQGNAVAQCTLGNCYIDGVGVEKDFSMAVEWYRKSAEKDYALAQCILGLIYSSGEGVEKDMDKAMEWWRKAAEQGLDDAQYILGCCYANGNGVEKDMKEAIRWLQKAAEKGHPEALEMLRSLNP